MKETTVIICKNIVANFIKYDNCFGKNIILKFTSAFVAKNYSRYSSFYKAVFLIRSVDSMFYDLQEICYLKKYSYSQKCYSDKAVHISNMYFGYRATKVYMSWLKTNRDQVVTFAIQLITYKVETITRTVVIITGMVQPITDNVLRKTCVVQEKTNSELITFTAKPMTSSVLIVTFTTPPITYFLIVYELETVLIKLFIL